MKIKFYSIVDKKYIWLSLKEVQKGIPLGYILYSLIEKDFRKYNQEGIRFDMEG